MAGREQGPPTKMIRVAEDIAVKLGWITRVNGGRVADRVDPLLRPQVDAWYEEVRPMAERIAQVEADIGLAERADG